MSAPREIRILLVEDDLVDRIASKRALAADSERQYVFIEADTGEQGLQLAAQQRPDCILLDYHLPDQTGLEFLEALAQENGEVSVPVMVLTGGSSAALAVELMRRGARDYLTKDADRNYLGQISAAIERMLGAQRLLEAKRAAEARFRTLVEQIQAITYIWSTAQNRLEYVSPQIAMLGFTAEEWLSGPSFHEMHVHPEDRDRVIEAVTASRANREPLSIEYRMTAKDGKIFWFRDEAQVIHDGSARPPIQGILLDVTHSKLAEQTLQRSQAELRSLAAHQERIKENERKRIAQEIHDELGSLLTGIKAYVSVSVERTLQAGGTADPLLVDATRLADDAIGAVRRVITDLRPSVLDQLGVWEAMKWYANQIQTRSDLMCDCSIDSALSARSIDAELSTMLFRVVQEALTNTVRHANASHVSIRAQARNGEIVIEVKDNGKGIARKDPVSGQSWGIFGMHERARHFGGSLTISGRPGDGTTVELRIPIEDTDGH
ncbi:PAS domain S-box protein [Trinickia dabaoshanensis]|uniref:Oxygen sensor histidine kinase NreB n=1 Tax=Trinickia dabaoshanensis TaxID=564714 RepID=A0A2N7VRM4_9BURK|nr:response regulator [Trinickia dabaoshanensis]PMS19807.1 PAS domain S-box protein [Trinickia dabaoshanensis]